jgi:hypothetical protein
MCVTRPPTSWDSRWLFPALLGPKGAAMQPAPWNSSLVSTLCSSWWSEASLAGTCQRGQKKGTAQQGSSPGQKAGGDVAFVGTGESPHPHPPAAAGGCHDIVSSQPRGKSVCEQPIVHGHTWAYTLCHCLQRPRVQEKQATAGHDRAIFSQRGPYHPKMMPHTHMQVTQHKPRHTSWPGLATAACMSLISVSSCRLAGFKMLSATAQQAQVDRMNHDMFMNVPCAPT